MGAKPLTDRAADSGVLTPDYCREIETYLCRKNDGHLIRVVGPSFDIVSGWAAKGIPLKVAFSGIDRCFERYHAKGPRRRPIKIDFCDADVLDAFDEWRRAVGAPLGGGEETGGTADEPSRRGGASLVAHLERALRRLSSARAQGRIGEAFDPIIDEIARQHDAARSAPRGLRGDAREALLARLATLDLELLQAARGSLEESSRSELASEAAGQVSGFRDRMSPEALARARETAFDRLVRDYCGLPTLVG